VRRSLKHDEAMSEVPGDQNESGSFPERCRRRTSGLPVMENRIIFSLMLWSLAYPDVMTDLTLERRSVSVLYMDSVRTAL
jgi:hypothetical protein